MAIGDERRFDDRDLTTEHLERVSKGKKRVTVQVEKVYDGIDLLKSIAESRSYFVAPEQWAHILGVIRKEVDDLGMHLRRVAEKQARGKRRRFEW